MTFRALLTCLLSGGFIAAATAAHCDGAGDPTPVTSTDGQYFDKDGNPKWSPAAIEDVTPEMVALYFAEMGADDLKFN